MTLWSASNIDRTPIVFRMLSPELCWHWLVLLVDLRAGGIALPFFVGLAVFMMALHGGASVLGAPIVGIAAGGMTLAMPSQ
jgi:hypothetical protein